MTNINKLLLVFLVLSIACFGQTILTTTTLSAAITSAACSAQPNGCQLTVASATGITGAGQANQITTALYIDRELFWVNSVVGTTIYVQRGKGIGSSARPYPHASGTTVWIGAPNAFRNEQTTAETYGSCTATAQLALPKIYLYSGDVFDCIGGKWVQVNEAGAPSLGSVVASVAGSITPTGTTFHVSGALAITGMAVPNGWAPGMSMYIIPDGTFTWTAAGNIALAGTAVVNKLLIFTWSGTKWIPSYIA